MGAAAVPWRLWYRSHGIGGEAPTNVGAGGSLGRAGDSLRLSFDVFFDTTLWSVVPIVALIALGAALVWGDRRVAAFLAALLGLVFLGGAWVTYSYRGVPITADEALNPIVRYTGAIVLLAAVAMPLLLASVWRERDGGAADESVRRRGWPPRRSSSCRSSAIRRSCSPTALASPPPEDCVHIAKPGASGDLDLVFGRRDTPAEAERLLEQVKRVGYVDAQVQGDGCLRWKVVYTGIESYAQGASSAAEARGAGLRPQIEIAPPG